MDSVPGGSEKEDNTVICITVTLSYKCYPRIGLRLGCVSVVGITLIMVLGLIPLESFTAVETVTVFAALSAN